MPRLRPRLLAEAAAALCAALSAGALAAQSPYLVADLTQGQESPGNLPPSQFARMGDRVLFLFTDEQNGTEPWTSDGTAIGTSLIADLCPGPSCHSSYTSVATDGVQGFFIVEAPFQGDGTQELWRTDGTTTGTYRLQRSRSFVLLGTSPAGFIFVAFEPGRFTLWKTDGSVGGTVALASLPGLPGGAERLEERLLFFLPVQTGLELWATDGTASGTLLVRAFADFVLFDRPELVALGEIALFGVSDANGIRTLWRSDGTPAGTYEVFDVTPERIVPTDSQAFFFRSGQALELWRTDGSAAGTRKLREFVLDASSPHAPLGVSGDELFFPADDGAVGLEPWRSDGTAAGTWRIRDVCPGPCSSYPGAIATGLGGVFFGADDAVHSREPWFTDGTTGGTTLLADTVEGEFHGDPTGLGFVGGRALFVADESTLWSSNGTPSSTQSLPELPGFLPQPLKFIALDSVVLFPLVHFADSGFRLWQSDATAGGTHEIARLSGVGARSSRPDSLLSFREPAYGRERTYFRTYFLAYDEFGFSRTLYRSDGTQAGTETVDVDPLGEAFAVRLGATSAHLFVEALPSRLFAGDGTSFAEVFDGSRPVEATEWGDLAGDLVFTTYPEGLWKSDGDPLGTELLAELSTSPADGGRGYFVLLPGGRLAFPAVEFPSSGFWSTDGTAGGTMQLFENASLNAANEQDWAALGGSLFFLDYESRLWRSDGSVGDPTLLIDIDEDVTSRQPVQMTAAAGRLFFSEADAAHGEELWVTDGTAVGTHMLVDVWPGAGGSYPRELTAAGDRLYFSADHPTYGRELWVTDGVSAELVVDLWRGSARASRTRCWLRAARSSLPPAMALMVTSSGGAMAPGRGRSSFPRSPSDRALPILARS